LHIKPQIALPLEKTEYSKCYVVGWGQTEEGKQSPVLLSTKIAIQSHELCNTKFKHLKGHSHCGGKAQSLCENGIINADSQFCAGENWSNQTSGLMNDACGGDSGGPLYCEVNGRWIQYGVVSGGDGCGKKGYPGIYGTVANVRDWIETTTGEIQATTTLIPAMTDPTATKTITTGELVNYFL